MHNHNPHVIQLHDIERIESAEYAVDEQGVVTATLKLVLRNAKQAPLIALSADGVAPAYILVEQVALPGNTEEQVFVSKKEAIASTEPEHNEAALEAEAPQKAGKKNSSVVAVE